MQNSILKFYDKYKSHIIPLTVVTSLIISIWLIVWVWNCIMAYILYMPAPPFPQAFSELYLIIFHYQRFDLLAISAIYMLFLIPIPIAIYMRNKLGTLLLLIPAWFYGSITIGNILYTVFVYKLFDFSIFYPFQLIYSDYSESTNDWMIFSVCYICPFILSSVGIPMFIWTQTKKEKKRSQGKFGTAKQADIHYLHKHNFIIPYSKTQPNWIAIAKKNKKYVGIEKLSRFRHTMVIAPSRQGKGVAIAIPRILDSIDSCFILDLKSELFQTTYEESIRKGKIPIALDPYKVLDRYGDFPNEHIIRHMNPLNPRFIDVNDIFIRDEYIDSLVNALTCDAKYENEHFKDTAEAIFGALLEMYILQKGNLVELFDKFNSSDYEQIVHILEDIYDTTGSRRAIGAKGLLQKVDKKEGGGFLSTTFRSFDYILSNVWASFFSEDGFDFGELIDKKVDLYFIIPTRMAKQHSKVVRLMLNMFMINFELSNPIKLADRKFEVFIDEAGQIKCTREIENILEIYGEKGMCLTTFWQNLNQIKNCFERPDLITEADIIHIFGITSPESIKWIQDRAGQQTVDNESYNKNKSDSTGSKMNSSKSNSSGTTVSQTGVALYHSNEISEMTFDKQLIFLKGYRSFIADKIFYYNDPRYKGLFGINYVESKKDISRQIEQTISRSKVRFE